ncbi:MAG: hypothetical protein ACYTFI_18220, partial [Planctomycetota bacterium]
MRAASKAASLGAGLLLACCAQSFALAGTMVNETKRIVSKYNAFFRYPPKGTPNKTIVDGPLMGNGDLGVCIAATGDAKRFWLCKNDFWKLAHDYKSGPGGPRVFGGVDVKLPGYGGGWPSEQSLYDAVTVASYTMRKSEAGVAMRSWVAATENVLVIELVASERDADVAVTLWVKDGDGSEVESGAGDGTRWVVRKFTEGVSVPV